MLQQFTTGAYHPILGQKAYPQFTSEPCNIDSIVALSSDQSFLVGVDLKLATTQPRSGDLELTEVNYFKNYND